MKIRSLTCLAAMLATMPGVALGQPFNMMKATAGHLYFNMPGADMARHDGELKNCIYNWAGGINPEPDPFNGTGVIGAAVSGIMLSSWEAARKNINIEHCMIAKGWRLVRLDPEEGEKLAQMPQKDLASALAPYVSAKTPKGEIVRVWQNEEIYQSTIIAHSPQNADRHLLSTIAMSQDNPMLDGITSIDATARKQAMDARSKSSFWGMRTTKLSDATVPGPGQILLVYSIRTTKKKRQALTFLERADQQDPMSLNFFGVAGDNDYIAQADGSFLVHRAILVPPGTWYVQGGYMNMDNCLGAPFFEAADRSTVYIGTFDLTNDQLSVSTNLIAVNQALAGSPIKLTPAQWTNGYTYPCRQMSMYALEFDGFPFAPGYHWGSRAHTVQ